MIQIEEPGYDVTVIPVVHNVEFFAKFRQGPKFLFGPTQELKAEFGNSKIKMHECQTIKNTSYVYDGSLSINDEENEEFDDDDDKVTDDQPKIGPIAKLVCTMRDKVNNDLIPVLVKDWIKDLDFSSQ
jgi:hypothetical protein